MIALALAASVAPVRAQSLADVARKAREAREAVSPSGKLYTNKDLHPAPSTALPKDAAKSTTADATSPDAEAVAGAAHGPAKDRGYWSARLKAVHEQLERDQTYAAALQSRINALNADFVNRDDPAQKSVIERDRLRALAELGRLEQAIPNDKRAIDDLLEEGRRAGVPPGWLR
jgi:hypothetical protein